MAAQGYFPTSQSYAPGSYGCGTFIFAVILCFLIIGILILIYMLIVKPDGVLSVTYEFRGTAESRAQDEKTCPKCAEQIRAAAQVCRFCGYQFDLKAMVAAEEAIHETTRKMEAARLAAKEKTLAHRLGKWVGHRLR
jgi:ribosomal protein L40E